MGLRNPARMDRLQDINNERCILIKKLLMKEEHRFRIILNSIGDGVITTDQDGIVTGLNPT